MFEKLYILFEKLYIPFENKFYPENDDGNIEYKLRLDTKNDMGKKKLLTQMMWRLNEGYENTGIHNAHYFIGIYNNGTLGKLSEDQINKSIEIFKKVLFDADIELINDIKKNINDSYVYYAYIIKNNKINIIKEKNVVIIGDSQSGKTSLISNICYDIHVRNQILKHLHEKINGVTTAIKKEIIGIKNNKIINYVDYGGWDDIVLNSDTIINIYDIPVINIKTIINYILGIFPDMMIIISNTKVYSEDVTFYIDFCEFYHIKYNIFYKKDLINYDKNIFTNIFANLCVTDKINYDVINKEESIFRINDYYDIPERGFIVSGIQINNSFIMNDICYLVNNFESIEIKIKSIHKKNINFKLINENESGSINFEVINKNNKIKLSKNAYITSVKNDKNLINKINIISNKKIENGNYQLKIFTGNTHYNANCSIINNIDNIHNIDNIYKIEFDNPIKIQDKNIILLIFNIIYLCKIV